MSRHHRLQGPTPPSPTRLRHLNRPRPARPWPRHRPVGHSPAAEPAPRPPPPPRRAAGPRPAAATPRRCRDRTWVAMAPQAPSGPPSGCAATEPPPTPSPARPSPSGCSVNPRLLAGRWPCHAGWCQTPPCMSAPTLSRSVPSSRSSWRAAPRLAIVSAASSSATEDPVAEQLARGQLPPTFLQRTRRRRVGGCAVALWGWTSTAIGVKRSLGLRAPSRLPGIDRGPVLRVHPKAAARVRPRSVPWSGRRPPAALTRGLPGRGGRVSGR
jgi:hypothetical protein